ncbi:MAG TPA: helix-turn-helix domain-containing protein [Dehalococcoidia bacterium]|nr:helix-turn-helix domain-containing protein [Dehalococcoidia bacterium]
MGRYDPSGGSSKGRKRQWEAEGVRALRRHLGLSQRQMADELGTRQQTVSEWETGLYRPRGASARLLTIIAERAGFQYEAGGRKQETGDRKDAGPGHAPSA